MVLCVLSGLYVPMCDASFVFHPLFELVLQQ